MRGSGDPWPGPSVDRALYKPYYKGYEPRLGAAWKVGERWVFRGGYGISQFMEGTGATRAANRGFPPPGPALPSGGLRSRKECP